MEVEVKVPVVGESVKEVVLYRWLKQNGEYVAMDENICELETDKATLELAAEQAGVLIHKAEEGETYDIGDVVALIDTSKSAPKGASKPEAKKSGPEAKEPAKKEEPKEKKVPHPSPAASKILSQAQISPAQVAGTGKDGRITKGDALKATSQKPPAPPSSPTPKQTKPAPQPVAVQMTGKREIRREKMTGLRKSIARRLLQAKHETAMLTTFNEIDMSSVMQTRKEYKEIFKEQHGIGLGFMSFFTKAVTIAMQSFPVVNASIDGDEIVYHDYADIGIAVSAPRGLVVPVIRNAETLSLAGLESEVRRLAKKARDNKITIDELTGGTFTITNGGVFGSMLSTPLINYPQSAILGMHNIVERPVGVNGQIVLRPIMYVALSYDHRIIDGRESVSFLKKVKELLDDPIRLLLQA